MGFTALISAILGLVSGSIPRAFDLVGKHYDHKREMQIREKEMEFRKLDHQLTLERVNAEASVRMNESFYEAAAEEAKATREQMVELIKQQFAPTGVAWIDAFNSVIRPACAIVILAMFVASVMSFMFGLTAINADFAKEMAALFTLSVEAVIGFIFGYRSALKPPGGK